MPVPDDDYMENPKHGSRFLINKRYCLKMCLSLYSSIRASQDDAIPLAVQGNVALLTARVVLKCTSKLAGKELHADGYTKSASWIYLSKN